MQKTIAAYYDDAATAQRVAEVLLEAGFSGEDISLLMKSTQADYHEVKAGEGASFGALVGALIGITSLLVPGLGSVIGAGPLGAALSASIGAAAGALMGGITAALLDLGIPEQDAAYFSQVLRRGGVLVTLTTNEQWIEWGENIMNRYLPVDVEEHTVARQIQPDPERKARSARGTRIYEQTSPPSKTSTG